MFLALLDLLLALWVFVLPDGFFRSFFGIEHRDPEALLYRNGAYWGLFALLQFLAYLYWPTSAYWLLIVVGVRVSEWCADWVFLFLENDFTAFGTVGFFLSSPFTVSLAVYFYSAFLRFNSGLPPTFSVSWLPVSPLVIDGLLIALVVVDALAARKALRRPAEWFSDFHGTEPSDPAGLLSRIGGVCLGFVVLQLVVLLSWRIIPEGLLILVGSRLAILVVDWVYLLTCRHRTRFAWMLLTVTPVLNAFVAVALFQGFVTIR